MFIIGLLSFSRAVSSAAMASIIPLRDGQVTAIDETAVLTPVLR
jgi:hypothetical protein